MGVEGAQRVAHDILPVVGVDEARREDEAHRVNHSLREAVHGAQAVVAVVRHSLQSRKKETHIVKMSGTAGSASVHRTPSGPSMSVYAHVVKPDKAEKRNRCQRANLIIS